jgi:hypothetical protein
VQFLSSLPGLTQDCNDFSPYKSTPFY